MKTEAEFREAIAAAVKPDATTNHKLMRITEVQCEIAVGILKQLERLTDLLEMRWGDMASLHTTQGKISPANGAPHFNENINELTAKTENAIPEPEPEKEYLQSLFHLTKAGKDADLSNAPTQTKLQQALSLRSLTEMELMDVTGLNQGQVRGGIDRMKESGFVRLEER